MLKVIIHKQLDSFYKIFPPWEVLKEKFHEVTIFQDINWIKSWWEYLNKQKEVHPYIIEIKSKDTTIGIVPLYSSKIKYKGLELRVLRPFGAEHSDYVLPILSKNHSPDKLLHLAFDKLYEDKISWDYIEWGDVPEDSFLANYLNNEIEKKSPSIIRNTGAVCPNLNLDGSIEDIKLKLSKSLLKEVLKKERKLNQTGEVQFNKVKLKEEIGPVLNKFFELHCERWSDTSTPSVFRHKEARESALNLANTLFENNLLFLVYLTYNNEIIGIDFGMSDGKKVYLYLHAINNKYRKSSPGNILTYHIILQAFREGHEIVDFLRGDEEYKNKWGTIDKVNLKYTIFNSSVKSLFLKMGYSIIIFNPQFKKLAKRLFA